MKTRRWHHVLELVTLTRHHSVNLYMEICSRDRWHGMQILEVQQDRTGAVLVEISSGSDPIENIEAVAADAMVVKLILHRWCNIDDARWRPTEAHKIF